MILAQASDYAAVVAALTNIGFSAAVAIYMIVYGLPKLQATFEKAILDERERADARELRKEVIAREEIQLLAADSKDKLAEVLRHCEREAARRDVTLLVVDKSLVNVGEVLEEVRDELREH